MFYIYISICISCMHIYIYTHTHTCICILLLFSPSVLFDSLWPHGLQHAHFPVLHYLPEFVQTHVQWIGDAIQPSHPLLLTSLHAFNLSQHQGLFQWVSCSHQVDKILELQLQHQSFQWIFRGWFPLGFTSLMSLQSKGLSRVFSSTSTTVWKHQFFSAQLSLWSKSHICTWLLEKP